MRTKEKGFPSVKPIFSDILWSYMYAKPNESCYVDYDHRSYKFNSFGHRGPEFFSDVDLLVTGCSVTYGVGLDLEETWGHLVAKELGYTYNLLAYPGISIAKMVRQILAYIENVGKPKRILALMPEPRRVDLFEPMPDQHGSMIANVNSVRLKLNKFEDLIYETPPNSLKFQDIDYTTLLSINAIYMLDAICSALGIQLLWTTWESRRVYTTYSDFHSFFEMDVENGDNLTSEMNCHVLSGANYSVASDNSHWGSHYHMHVAEEFIRRLREDQR